MPRRSLGLVSLVMPAWNPRPDWLQGAVQSCLAQRGCSIELIVVDDGSDQPVADLLADVRDPRLRVIRVDHAGASAARNAGIAEAHGDYLRFVDADDEVEVDGTSTLVELTQGRDDIVAYGATMFCDEDLRPLWLMTSDVQGDAVEACLLGRFTTRPHAFLFPRAVVRKTGDWSSEMRISEDWDFVLRALEHSTVRGSRAVATFYRRRADGATGDPAEGERGAGMVIDRYFQRHPEQRGTRLERRVRARLMAHAGRVYATHGKPTKAISRLGRAAATDPTAVWVEARQALPAVAGRARRRLRG
jgi:glycosyltransferase involved in cell wall biosynthesis